MYINTDLIECVHPINKNIFTDRRLYIFQGREHRTTDSLPLGASQAARRLARKPTKCPLISRSFLPPKSTKRWQKYRKLRSHSQQASMHPLKICDICHTLMIEQDSLQCGHTYCSQCWKDYLEAMVGSGVLVSKCPKFACALTVPESLIEKYLETRKFDQYIRLKCEHFVLFSKGVRRCPAPNSTFIAEFPTLGMCEIACKCGHTYCFACGEEAHPSTPCHLMKKWRIKSLAERKLVAKVISSFETPIDAKTSDWILKNTKPCPHCSIAIEKNQGCNHMTCGGCGGQFCWLCLTSWAGHSTARCRSRGIMQSIVSERQYWDFRAEREKYNFYFDRFMSHYHAQRLAQISTTTVEKAMRQLHDWKHYSIGELEFLQEAALQVVNCRRVLKCAHVFAYYLDPGQESYLFELWLAQLEENTELLHKLSEENMSKFLTRDCDDKAQFYCYRSSLLDFTQANKQLVKKMLDEVESGSFTYS